MPLIRLATPDDAAAIADIYRPYVRDTAISFETEAPSVAEMAERIEQTLRKYPWFVHEDGGHVLGYAYAGPFRSRCAYSWTVESSVYVRQGCHGQGVGRRLYLALLETLKRQGAVNVIGAIGLPNEASVRLHENVGFVKVAHLKDIGFKLGRWWDVGYWELQLQKPMQPSPLRSMHFPE